MTQISQALTHSDIKTTEIYVNTPNVVDLSTNEKFKNVQTKPEKLNRITPNAPLKNAITVN